MVITIDKKLVRRNVVKDLYFTGDVYTRPEDNIAVGSIYRVSLYHTIREEKRGQYRT